METVVVDNTAKDNFVKTVRRSLTHEGESRILIDEIRGFVGLDSAIDGPFDGAILRAVVVRGDDVGVDVADVKEHGTFVICGDDTIDVEGTLEVEESHVARSVYDGVEEADSCVAGDEIECGADSEGEITIFAKVRRASNKSGSCARIHVAVSDPTGSRATIDISRNT
jgi:hypothetical protein